MTAQDVPAPLTEVQELPLTTPGTTPPPRGVQAWHWLSLAALVFLVAHLLSLGPTLDDIDAVNFAFGVQDFDPAAHHPHPPGYPVYIALAKLSTGVVDAARPLGDRAAALVRDNAALALALWSALFGAVGLLAWYVVFLQLESLHEEQDARAGTGDGRRKGELPPRRRSSMIAASAAVLMAAAPLTWLTSARPLSDVPGLVAATIAQALLLAAWRREERGVADDRRRPAISLWAALAAAIALGVRSQVAWLTLPLLAAVLVARAGRRGARAGVSGLLAYGVGVTAWAIPMIVATAGWERYVSALGDQGAEDFAGVDMLWTHFGWRRFLVGLDQTFVLPWSSPSLAVVVLLLAAAGFVWMLRHARPALALLGLMTVPYAVFHLLFQETATTRYALPLVPAVCYLAVRGMAWSRRRSVVILPAALVVWSLVVAVPALWAYASQPSPIFRAIRDMRERAATLGGAPALAMHRRIATESRAALEWTVRAAPWSRRLPSPRDGEWLQAARFLRDEPDSAVWFLTEPSRSLALLDRRARVLVGRYRWDPTSVGLLDGVRPDSMDLYEIRRPGWMVGQGWALTPEAAGVAARDQAGPSYRPITALLRRRPDEVVVLLGGRHLGTAEDGPALVEVRLDGRPLADFEVADDPRFFVRFLRLAAGDLAGQGAFAALTVGSRPADGGPGFVPVAIEQFDVQGVDDVVHAYGAGWQEAEYDPAQRLSWRWMSERAVVLVQAGGRAPLTLRVTGESPRRYFDRPSTLRVLVGSTELARLTPDERTPRVVARALRDGRFDLSVRIPRDLLARASGQIILESDQHFVPAERAESADRRHLSVRVLELTIE